MNKIKKKVFFFKSNGGEWMRWHLWRMNGEWMEICVVRPFWHRFGIKRKADVALMENGWRFVCYSWPNIKMKK